MDEVGAAMPGATGTTSVPASPILAQIAQKSGKPVGLFCGGADGSAELWVPSAASANVTHPELMSLENLPERNVLE
jgi:hypothetical protein